MVMPKKMFIIVSSFLFGYCAGYYSFELVKSKNQRYEIHDFFLSYNKKMANSVESLITQLEEVKINNNCFFGEDLSYEQNFLEKIEEKIEKEIPGSEICYLFRKRSMALCFEIPSMNEKIQSIYSIEEVLIIIKISKNSKKLK